MSIDPCSSHAKLLPPNIESEDCDWKSTSKSELQSEAKAESEPDLKRPRWELKGGSDDLYLSDFAIYDNDPVPMFNQTKNGSYMNKAYKAEAEFVHPQTGPWDAVKPPNARNLVGGVRPYDITDEKRPRFIHYCNLSLNMYNAENQGANFVFYELVKATSPISCPLYYITFMAKDASNINNADVSTFQAIVRCKFRRRMEAEAILCKRKPN